MMDIDELEQIDLEDLETAQWNAERGKLDEALLHLVRAMPRFHNLLKLTQVDEASTTQKASDFYGITGTKKAEE